MTSQSNKNVEPEIIKGIDNVPLAKLVVDDDGTVYVNLRCHVTNQFTGWRLPYQKDYSLAYLKRWIFAINHT